MTTPDGSSSVAPPMIVPAATMTEVQAIITQHVKDSAKTLVAWDVDMTLTVSKHPALYYPNMAKHKAVLHKIFEPFNTLEKDRVWNFATQTHEQQLTEENIPAIIRSIQAQGIKTMALTALLTGRLGNLERGEVLRFQKLQALGIDFRQAFADTAFVLADIPAYNGHHPVYHQGILCANGEEGQHTKGTVLVAFLQRVSFSPQLVVMVDDIRKNLEDIQQALVAFNPAVQFIGITYLGAYTYAPEGISEKALAAFWQEMAAKLVPKTRLSSSPIK